jgi:hypothetical protein
MSYLPSPFPENSLAETNPMVAEEWDYDENYPLTPYNFSAGSGRKVGWVCKIDTEHRWKASIDKRTGNKNRKGTTCPFCKGQKVDKTNSFGSKHPELLSEWDYDKNKEISPSQLTANSGVKVWWQCKCGFSWQASPDTRVKGHGHLGTCAAEVESARVRSKK